VDRRTFLGTSVGALAMSAGEQAHTEAFVGSWDLVSYELVLPSGAVTRLYGDSPSGLILYHGDGRMSAQLSVGHPAKFAGDDPLNASDEEAAHAWRTYFGYWGSFRVDTEKGVVVHRVEGCSFSNWIETDQVRHFRFDRADRLILETSSPSGLYTLTWQRRAAQPNGRA
jgi:Lipocalin-like domain